MRVFGLLVGIIPGSLVMGFINGVLHFNDVFAWIGFFLVIILFAFIFGSLGAKTKSNLPARSERLTNSEKIMVWILCIINPVICGGIFYFFWKKCCPVKAKKTSQIAMTVLLVYLFLGIVSILI